MTAATSCVWEGGEVETSPDSTMVESESYFVLAAVAPCVAYCPVTVRVLGVGRHPVPAPLPVVPQSVFRGLVRWCPLSRNLPSPEECKCLTRPSWPPATLGRKAIQ